MLAGAGVRAAVGGNLGTPALELLEPAGRALRAGALQLPAGAERAGAAAAAVVLNVTPDHLDIHGDMAAYTAAKARIYARCAPRRRQSRPAGAGGARAGRHADGGLRPGRAGGRRISACWTRGDGAWLARGRGAAAAGRRTAGHRPPQRLQCPGGAGALRRRLAARLYDLLPGLRGYRPLPHRMTLVARRNGVTWIDDSKATNVGAAVTSIGSVDGPLVLIAGGDGKGASFSSTGGGAARPGVRRRPARPGPGTAGRGTVRRVPGAPRCRHAGRR